MRPADIDWGDAVDLTDEEVLQATQTPADDRADPASTLKIISNQLDTSYDGLGLYSGVAKEGKVEVATIERVVTSSTSKTTVGE